MENFVEENKNLNQANKMDHIYQISGVVKHYNWGKTLAQKSIVRQLAISKGQLQLEEVDIKCKNCEFDNFPIS